MASWLPSRPVTPTRTRAMYPRRANHRRSPLLRAPQAIAGRRFLTLGRASTSSHQVSVLNLRGQTMCRPTQLLGLSQARQWQVPTLPVPQHSSGVATLRRRRPPSVPSWVTRMSSGRSRVRETVRRTGCCISAQLRLHLLRPAMWLPPLTTALRL